MTSNSMVPQSLLKNSTLDSDIMKRIFFYDVAVTMTKCIMYLVYDGLFFSGHRKLIGEGTCINTKFTTYSMAHNTFLAGNNTVCEVFPCQSVCIEVVFFWAAKQGCKIFAARRNFLVPWKKF